VSKITIHKTEKFVIDWNLARYNRSYKGQPNAFNCEQLNDIDYLRDNTRHCGTSFDFTVVGDCDKNEKKRGQNENH